MDIQRQQSLNVAHSELADNKANQELVKV